MGGEGGILKNTLGDIDYFPVLGVLRYVDLFTCKERMNKLLNK